MEFQCQIDSTDRQFDELVYEVYGLTIKIVEEENDRLGMERVDREMDELVYEL